MGVVQLRQIRSYLETHVSQCVDVSDYEKKPDEERANATMSRSLMGLSLSDVADISIETAVNCIIDGYNDNGIDAIYYNSADRVLYLGQSKWSNDGTGSVDLAGAEKFCRGVKDFLALKLSRFNAKVMDRQPSLSEAVNNTVRIVLVVCHSGSEKLGEHASRSLHDLLGELNDTGEVASLEVLGQEKIYTIVSGGGRSEPVDIAIQLFDWGLTKQPYQAFYGQVAASDVAEWGGKWRQRLFSKNIRSFLGANTAVNLSIIDTLKKNPQIFWYLNNGITAICSSISKRAVGGNSRDAGTFECRGVSIVNGAQTVGTITELLSSVPEQLASARVPIRLISLEGCPPEFASEVTRATNTQNRVDSRNFVALDMEQARLRSELLVDGVEYEFRQGESELRGPNKFGLTEATVALACSLPSIDVSVQAKREISKLWDDIQKSPYKNLFNSGTSSMKMWNTVQIVRYIEDTLSDIAQSVDDLRIKSICINGNRFISSAVLRRLSFDDINLPSFDMNIHKDIIGVSVRDAVERVNVVINECYAGAYLAQLFKNLSKCRDIDVKMSGVVLGA